MSEYREYPVEEDGTCCLCDNGIAAYGECVENGEHIRYPIFCICKSKLGIPTPVKEMLQEVV